jgi:hypothetical protein
MKDLIKADVIRTNQEFAYFKRASTQDMLKQILYLWNTEHDIGYKQGMNELLAVILIVFDTERDGSVCGCEPQFLEHDVYSFFDALLTTLGVSKLYQETKDISDLSAEITNKVPNHKLFGVEPNEAKRKRMQA